MTLAYDLTDIRLRPPPPKATAGEWDWFYALSFGDQQVCRRHMVPHGVGPEDLADMVGSDIDEACTRWRLAIRGDRLGAAITDEDLFDNYDLVAAVSASGLAETQLDPAELVGAGEVAERLGVKLATVHQWRTRRLLPDALAILTSTPIWRWSTVEAWARETGRL